MNGPAPLPTREALERAVVILKGNTLPPMHKRTRIIDAMEAAILAMALAQQPDIGISRETVDA